MIIQSNFKYIFATSVKRSDYTRSPFVHKLAKTYPFRRRGFHTPVEWKIVYKGLNKQVITHSLKEPTLDWNQLSNHMLLLP